MPEVVPQLLLKCQDRRALTEGCAGVPQSLRKGGKEGANNFLGALLAVPRNTRMMFVHAVQVLTSDADVMPSLCGSEHLIPICRAGAHQQCRFHAIPSGVPPFLAYAV